MQITIAEAAIPATRFALMRMGIAALIEETIDAARAGNDDELLSAESALYERVGELIDEYEKLATNEVS